MSDSCPSDGSFSDWAGAWLTLAQYAGSVVPDVAARIASVVTLWHQPIPTETWRRGRDARLLDPTRRYCRGNHHAGAVRRGEHALEYELLGAEPGQSRVMVMGAELVDGVNAVPLARDDEKRGRAGNVEADMLLLVRTSAGKYRLELVEVKISSNNAWYAAIENLRQLRLLGQSPETRRLFHCRRPDLKLSPELPASGLVLAPEAFFTARGQKE
jgi:hypothetical protein